MYRRFLLILLVSYSAGNETDVGIYDLFQEPSPNFKPLSGVIKHAFKNHRCVQITTDESPFAFDMMEQIYKLMSTWSYINGVNVKSTTDAGTMCNGYILIAKRLRVIKNLLKKIPLYYEHRIVCLVGGGWHKNLYSFIINAQEIFKDSEALLAVLGSHPFFYKRTQPNEFMERIVFPRGQWKNHELGIEDFNNKEIVIGTFNCSVFTELGPPGNDNVVVPVKGAEVKILFEIFKRLNLKYRIKVPNDEDPYGKFINGKWSGGLMKMITRREVDMAHCGIWHTHSMSLSEMDMSLPLGQVCIKFIVPRPKLLSSQWYDIFRPFSIYLWILLSSLVLIFSFFLKIFKIITSYNDREIKQHPFSKCLVQVISIFLQSGVLRTQKGALGQLVLWFVIFSILLSSGFSGRLISNLFKPRYSTKIEAIPDLISRNYFWTESVVPDIDVIFNSDEEWQVEWIKRLRVIPTEKGLEEALRTKKYVKYGVEYEGGFIFEKNYNLKILEEYEAASYCYKKFFIGFVHRKGSPFIKPFKKYIQRFHNGGIVKKLSEDAVRELITKIPCTITLLKKTKSQINEPRKLKMYQLQGIFLVWTLGILLSTVIFGIEKYIFKYHTKPKK